jgi:cyanophycin synthetase
VDVNPLYASKLNAQGKAVFDALKAAIPGIFAAEGEALPGVQVEATGGLIALIALHLQRLTGLDGELAFAIASDHENEVEVLYSYESEDIGLEAGGGLRYAGGTGPRR